VVIALLGLILIYFLHKSEEMGCKPTLLHSSRTINNSVASFVVDKTIKLLLDADKVIKDSSVLVLGYTFKENCADTRNKKVKDTIEGLESFSVEVPVFDPYFAIDLVNNFIANTFAGSVKYHAIIVTVSCQDFIYYSTADFRNISKGKLVLLNPKGIYNNATWKF